MCWRPAGAPRRRRWRSQPAAVSSNRWHWTCAAPRRSPISPASSSAEGRCPSLLVNNAGINISGVFEELSAAQGRAIVDTNFHGVADTIRAFLPAMRERRPGTLLTIGSLAGLLAPPGEAFYAASKHALEGLHEALQHELHRFGIRVCLAEPGFIRTDLARSVSASEQTIADCCATSTKSGDAGAGAIHSRTCTGTSGSCA
jgi:short-subunit dehydrogenase